MQETRNKIPAASVYLLEKLHFLQFFIADSVPGSIIMVRERSEDLFPENHYRRSYLLGCHRISAWFYSLCRRG